MNTIVNYIGIANKETNKFLFALEDSKGDYLFATVPPLELEKVRKRSVGKRIREFMKEKNGKQEKTRG